jgi:RNA polymerase sigma-70 factor (ECF subfamily)
MQEVLVKPQGPCVAGNQPLSSDARLVQQALQGDRTAFEQLVRAHLERTFHLVLRLVGNREDAEDVVQETFVRAHSHLDQFRGRSSFTTWVTRIAIRLCLDLERARGRRPAFQPLDGDHESLLSAPGKSVTPPERAQHRETLAQVERAVATLPPRLRAALVLRVLQGEDYATVAAAIGTTVRSARIYVSEARRRLAELLPRELEELGS